MQFGTAWWEWQWWWTLSSSALLWKPSESVMESRSKCVRRTVGKIRATALDDKRWWTSKHLLQYSSFFPWHVCITVSLYPPCSYMCWREPGFIGLETCLGFLIEQLFVGYQLSRARGESSSVSFQHGNVFLGFNVRNCSFTVLVMQFLQAIQSVVVILVQCLWEWTLKFLGTMLFNLIAAH